MKVAVTGASGYLGGLVVRRLEAEREVDSILGLDVVRPRFRARKLTFREADVRTADFKQLFEGVDVVYHLAFVVEPPKGLSMRAIEAINVVGSTRVFEGAAAAGVPKVVYSSSIAAYGAHQDNHQNLTEEAALRPNRDFYYSRTKGRVERFLDEFEKTHPGIIVIRLRPCIFLGSGIGNIIGAGVASRILVGFRDEVRMNLAWDEDVAEAFALALHHGRSDAFNLAGDHPLTVSEMGRLSGKRVLCLDRRWVLPILEVGRRLGLIGRAHLEWVRVASRYPITVSSEKAKRVLGWRPRFDSPGTYVKYLRSIGQVTPEHREGTRHRDSRAGDDKRHVGP